jgi:hypothetical protein
MSSEAFPYRQQPRRTFTDQHSRSGVRFGAARLAEQQAEAAMRQLRECFDAVEARPRDRKAAGDAIRAAWSALSHAGFSDFDQIRLVRTEDWPHVIDSSLHALISLALEIVGWYQFGLRPYDIDRTARIFDRCLELTPHNQRALDRFATVANEIKPEHIGGLAKFPKKQRETALGYRLQCKRKIDNILLDVFGITEAHLVGQAPTPITQLIASRKDSERRFVFSILGHLSRINKAVGDFFGNGTQLSLGMGAACCQLEMLDLPRDLSNLLTILKARFEEASADEVVGEETPIVKNILSAIAEICDCKWRIFRNHASQRRAQELQDFIAQMS